MSDPEDIRGWQRLTDRITTSGALRPDDPARLAAIGVAHVINLALDSHRDALADEGERCAALGIGYSHIPVPFDAPTDAHFKAFRAALDAMGGEAAHVHCIANFRVSAFFYRLNRDYLGMAEPQARALMEMQWAPDRTQFPEQAAWRAFIAPRPNDPAGEKP